MKTCDFSQVQTLFPFTSTEGEKESKAAKVTHVLFAFWFCGKENLIWWFGGANMHYHRRRYICIYIYIHPKETRVLGLVLVGLDKPQAK